MCYMISSCLIKKTFTFTFADQKQVFWEQNVLILNDQKAYF